ncbi:MAG: hypothetical protein SFU21_00005 [Flavihumibacter sp.]|nr:hypothetical protein [Flavihumibacter sp.]
MKKIFILTCLILLIASSLNKANARCVVCFRHESGVNKCFILWESSCSDGPVPSGKTIKVGPWRFACKDFRIITKVPIIQYDSKQNAVLIDGAVVTSIASDYLEDGFKKINKNDFKSVESLLQKDDHVVSLKRLEIIAKQLNAQVIKVEELSQSNYSCCLGGDKAPPDDDVIAKNERFGGSIDGPIIDKHKKGLLLSIGSGINSPGSSIKTNSSVLNGIQLLVDIYVPISPISNSIDFGVTSSFQYEVGTGNYTTDGFNVYNIQGQASPPAIQARGSGSPRQAGFRGIVSPQISVGANRTILRGGVGFGYMTMTQQPMSIVQISQNGSQLKEYGLLNQSLLKANGLLLMPNLRISHFFGKLGIWGEAQYLIGPQIKSTATKFVPQGSANQNGNYTLTQMELGNIVPVVREIPKYQSLGLNVGVSISVGKPWFVKCLVCGRRHRLGHCRSKFTEQGISQDIIVNKPTRKHYCLICGRRHRGKCKYGYADETSLTELLETFKVVGGDSKLYHSDISETDCNSTKGIQCTEDISVSDNFDIESFDKYVGTDDPQRIKDIFNKNDMTKFLLGLMELRNSKKVIEALKSGNLTLKKIPALKYSYQLGTPKNISSQKNDVLKITFRKKQEYNGHVTLLR